MSLFSSFWDMAAISSVASRLRSEMQKSSILQKKFPKWTSRNAFTKVAIMWPVTIHRSSKKKTRPIHHSLSQQLITIKLNNQQPHKSIIRRYFLPYTFVGGILDGIGIFGLLLGRRVPSLEDTLEGWIHLVRKCRSRKESASQRIDFITITFSDLDSSQTKIQRLFVH